MKTYYKAMKKRPLLSWEREQLLGRRVQAGDEEAREEMILANLRLVVKIANLFTWSGLSVEDLIEEGNIGLMEAVDRFDPEREVRFGTYAVWWIKHRIRRAIHDQARTVRVPSNVHDFSQKMNRVAESIQFETGAEPTLEVLSEYVGVPALRLAQVRAALQPIRSLDAPLDGADGNVLLSDHLPDEESIAPGEAAARRDTLGQLLDLVGRLPERDRNILKWRFGLFQTAPLTLDEIGVRLGISRERVRQLQNRAIERLKLEFSALEAMGAPAATVGFSSAQAGRDEAHAIPA